MATKGNIDLLREMCVKHGCRCTKQRLAVFEHIYCNKTHPFVDQIWTEVKKQVPSITRESVFRILTEFAEWGLVNRMDKIENARFDGVPGNHGHFICKKCGAVVDFLLPVNMPRPEMPGFCTQNVELRISGLCAACASKEKSDAHTKS